MFVIEHKSIFDLGKILLKVVFCVNEVLFDGPDVFYADN